MMDEPDADTAETLDVAVVGLGPVGITLCNILGQMGVRVVGIDARKDIYPLPRAIGMDHEVMRIFQNIGLADELTTLVGEYRNSEYRSADGELLRRFVSPPPPYKLGWPPYMTFVQPDLERKLHAKAARSDFISLRTGFEVVALEKPGAPVLTISDTNTGKTEMLRPKFVVGCDGGGSFVRRQLGIKFEDLIFDQPWLVIDVLLTDAAPPLPETNVQFCDPSRPHTFVYGPGRLRRWEFMMLPGETPEQINQTDRIWQLLSPWLKPGQAEIWRSATYRFHALVAEKWRSGHVFLAGDACHMTPPFLAQGMVQGIKDAANLGWRLGYVLRGGPERLLDSYEEERKPHVHAVISIAKNLGTIICEIDREKAKRRDDELKSRMASGEGTQIRQNLFPPILGGVIALGPDSKPVPGAGEQCPQPYVVSNNQRLRMDDALGNGFVLIFRGLKPSGDILDYAARLSVAVYDIDIPTQNLQVDGDNVLRDWLSHLNATAVISRPDHVVFGTANSDEHLKMLLDQLASWIAQ
jgi:3-(3-hydroxy-phenyl)propionate hydroxylase